MTSMDEDQPSCYGILDSVFPVGANGLRESPSTCLGCWWKTDCLQTAMGSEQGMEIRESMLDRAYDSGMLGFFERWSRKKYYQRSRFQRKQKKPGEE